MALETRPLSYNDGGMTQYRLRDRASLHRHRTIPPLSSRHRTIAIALSYHRVIVIAPLCNRVNVIASSRYCH